MSTRNKTIWWEKWKKKLHQAEIRLLTPTNFSADVSKSMQYDLMRSAFEKAAASASTPCYSIWTDEPWRQRDPALSRDRHSNFFSCEQDITQVDWALPSLSAYDNEMWRTSTKCCEILQSCIERWETLRLGNNCQYDHLFMIIVFQ